MSFGQALSFLNWEAGAGEMAEPAKRLLHEYESMGLDL